MATEKQTKFKDAYVSFIEGGMSDRQAKRLAKQEAGYAESTNLSDIMSDDLMQEILTDLQRKMTLLAIKAVEKQCEVLENPDAKGTTNLQAAINSVLDRVGIAKKESREITLVSPTGVVFLPAKQPLQDEA